MRPYPFSAQEGSVGTCAYCNSSWAGKQCWCNLLQDMNLSFPVFHLFLPTHQPWSHWLPRESISCSLTHHSSFFFLSHLFISLSPAEDKLYETWKHSLKTLKITGQTSDALNTSRLIPHSFINKREKSVSHRPGGKNEPTGTNYRAPCRYRRGISISISWASVKQGWGGRTYDPFWPSANTSFTTTWQNVQNVS